MKDIKGFEGKYKVSTSGQVFSVRRNSFLKPYVDGKGKYLYVSLGGRKYSIHRLVGQAYLPNPENKPEIDHIDGNTKNNNLNNLTWATRKENMKRAFEKTSPVRNFKKCSLYKSNLLIANFESVLECARYCRDTIGLSYSSMSKYRKYKDYAIRCND